MTSFKAFTSWLKAKIEYVFPKEATPTELSLEREEEIIDKIELIVARYGMQIPAMMFMAPLKGMSTIISQTWLLNIAPYLEMFGVPAFELSAFLYKKENVERLLDRLEKSAKRG